MTQQKIKNYKDFVVWQKSVDLCEMVYNVTTSFPKSELFGIVNQMRRSSVSIPSNIAEGCGRKLKSFDQRQFLRVALGSAQELETQTIISRRLGFISEKEKSALTSLILEIIKMLTTLIFKSEFSKN